MSKFDGPPAKVASEVMGILRKMGDYKATNRLLVEYAAPWTTTTPGPYRWQVEFHDRGAKSHHRALISANQTGKSRCASAEMAIHLIGRYPDWWKGKRFTRPIESLAVEPTNTMCRDIAQKLLLGRIVNRDGDRVADGTGWIPADRIMSITFRQCGVTQVVDTSEIKSDFGGVSILKFMSCEQGSTKFQGVQFDLVWMDEEPEDLADAWNIWSELNTRLALRDGHLILTRTPLYGDTDIIRHFVNSDASDVWFKRVGWDDSPHWSDDQKKRQLLKYKDHERDTRSKGYVMLGEGAVYPVEQGQNTIEPREIPKWWRRIVGIDFGIAEDHPAAAVWIAYDEDADCIYVYDSYRISHQTSLYHADALRSRGAWIPVAWPHDGMLRDKAAGGMQLAEAYRMHGANMLPESARYPATHGEDEKGGGQPRAPVTDVILERMKTARIRIFNTQVDLLEEIRGMHRKDNQIVARRDDLESALRYAVMMLRYATTQTESETVRPQFCDSYDPFAVYQR